MALDWYSASAAGFFPSALPLSNHRGPHRVPPEIQIVFKVRLVMKIESPSVCLSDSPALDAPTRSFDTELLKCSKYWAKKLSFKSNGVFDEDDLCGIFGVKLSSMQTKLQELFGNPKVFRKYVGVVCKNEYKDQLDKRFAVKNNDISNLSTDLDYENQDGDAVAVLDFLATDEERAAERRGVPIYTLEDIKALLTPDEYKIVFDCFIAGTSLRELAEDRGSKSQLGRVTKQLKVKLRAWLENCAPLSWPSRRPDRISKENVDNWNSLQAKPFYVCQHLMVGTNQVGPRDTLQDFSLPGAAHISERYGLCGACWRMYWFGFMRWAEETIWKLENEGWELLGPEKS
jgi:hypothetical protein